MDADRGRGAYDLPSFGIVLDDLGVALDLNSGTSSATSMTELSVIFSALLRLDIVGDTGSSAIVSATMRGASPGAVDCDE